MSFLARPWVRNTAVSVVVTAVAGGGMAATAQIQGLAGRLHSAEHALAAPRPAATVTKSPPARLLPASHPSPSPTPRESVSPVLVQRISPGAATVPGGSGTALAGAAAGSGGSPGGGSGGGSQPSQTPSPAPSSPRPVPSPKPTPKQTCVHAPTGLAVCAVAKIGGLGG